MYELKLIRGRSYTGHGVQASAKKPLVYTDDKEVADYLVESRRFMLLGYLPETPETPEANAVPETPEVNGVADTPAANAVAEAPLEEPIKEVNEEWSISQLTKYAKENGIELGSLKTKTHILEKIRKAEAAIDYSATV